MIEINGKSCEAHKMKLTKKDLKNLKKGETLIFICKEDNKAITVSMEDLGRYQNLGRGIKRHQNYMLSMGFIATIRKYTT